MNICFRTIILSLFLLLIFPEKCQAAAPDVSIGCKAEWADEKNGIAKVTLTQSDAPVTELVVGTTDYIFMVDGSRTTTLSDKYLFQENRGDQEPLESHCPCMAQGHYYMVGGSRVLPLTYTLGYDCGTGELRTWSASRRIWSDSAGAHFNASGARIPVRYANGCLDIFTIFKNETVKSVREIAGRKDGSKIAFIVYSGKADSLYGILNYTDNYEDAVRKIQNTGFEPGSLICPGIDRARSLYDGSGKMRTTKILMMGDGRNTDMDNALKKAADFRNQKNTVFYTACMGKEACVKGSGYQAMRSMSGNRADRFWEIQTRPQNDMAKIFAAALNEKVPVSVGIDGKRYSAQISGEWEYYENAAAGYRPACSAGSFSNAQDQITWIIPKDTKGTVQCIFYVRLKETSRYVSEKKQYEVLKNLELSYVIKGGSKDGQKGKLTKKCNTLEWKPSDLYVTKMQLLSGISYPKAEDVWYVKGGSENEVGFTSYTTYAAEAWKPEKNVMHQKSDRSGEGKTDAKTNTRSSDLSHLTSTFSTVLTLDGEVRRLYPCASIGKGKNEISTEKFDEIKKLTLICDAVPPDLQGSVPEIIREDTKLVFSAKDSGSGVKTGSFRLEILNPQTGEKKTVHSSGQEISWKIVMEEDSFYSGNLKWTLRAEDNVGNSAEISGISNIRPPKGGETIANEIRTRIL